MASVDRDSKGWRIRFYDFTGERKTLRPGKVNKSEANEIAGHLEELVDANGTGRGVRRRTSAWVSDVGPVLRKKLEKYGLVEPKLSENLHGFIDGFIARGKTAKNRAAAVSTRKKWKANTAHLKRFFDDVPLESISERDVQKFRDWLEDRPAWSEKTGRLLSENMIRSITATSKTIFNTAKRLKLIEENPFDYQVASTQENRSRDFYVTTGVAKKIIERCPNAQWRLLVALWRFAGLRKAEVFRLRWDDVLWDSGRFRVSCSKTAHHEGMDERFVPIGDVEKYFLDAYRNIESGDRIVTVHSPTNGNFDKPLKNIMKRAGILPWPKLFQNMRASCETDWLDRGIAAHVVAAWMGHSVIIQRKHYAQVDDHHFDNFNEKSGPICGPVAARQEQTGQVKQQKRNRRKS